MAKYYGKVGFIETVETAPDVWRPQITEHPYYGDVLNATRRWEAGEGAIEDTNVTNRISIVADPFARDHFGSIRYAYLFDQKWKVNSVEVQYPRLILSLGGLYNENTP